MPLTLRPALLLTMLLIAATAHAGGRMRSGGEGLVYTGLTLEHGDQFFDKQGRVEGDRDCGAGVSNSWHGEYGYSYYHTVFASTAFDLNPCDSRKAAALGDLKLGIRGRVIEFSDRLVWETTLILPTANATSRDGRTHDKGGAEFALYYAPRPDPYDLDIPRSHFDGYWNFGTGVRVWADDTPAEGFLEASWGRSLTQPDWRAGDGYWYLSSRLRAERSLWNTVRSDRPAIDPLDAYSVVKLSLSLSKQMTLLDAITFSVHRDLLGKNHVQSTGITIGYSHVFRN